MAVFPLSCTYADQQCINAGVTGAHHMRSMDAWLPPWRLNQSEKDTASSARTSRMPPSGSNSARTMGDVPSASELATCMGRKKTHESYHNPCTEETDNNFPILKVDSLSSRSNRAHTICDAPSARDLAT